MVMRLTDKELDAERLETEIAAEAERLRQLKLAGLRAKQVRENKKSKPSWKASKICPGCNTRRKVLDFDGWFGVVYTTCSSCRRALELTITKASSDRKEKRIAYGQAPNLGLDQPDLLVHFATKMLRAARRRARDEGVPINIELEDIVIPELCPVLGMRLKTNRGALAANSMTLDRTIPSLGYVKGNIVVMSHRANALKSNASSAELYAVADYVKSVELTLSK